MEREIIGTRRQKGSNKRRKEEWGVYNKVFKKGTAKRSKVDIKTKWIIYFRLARKPALHSESLSKN